MLKKAGIIVAGSAVALLAMTPLAFAQESAPAAPACSFAATNDNTVDQDADGVGSSLLGLLGTAANIGAPVNAQTQAPVLSCNELTSTTVDEDNDSVETDIEDSFND